MSDITKEQCPELYEAKIITEMIFNLPCDPRGKVNRLQFMGGDYPNHENVQGGINRESLMMNIALCLQAIRQSSPEKADNNRCVNYEGKWTIEDCNKKCLSPIHDDNCPLSETEGFDLPKFDDNYVYQNAALSHYGSAIVETGFREAHQHYEFEAEKLIYFKKPK